MIEEKNKAINKPLVFAIIGVTLLVIAVSGSAYAFFTASATSDQFTGNTLNVKIGKPTVTLKSATGTKGDGLIPIHDGTASGHTTNQLTTAVNSTNNCVDKNNYTVCKIYEISITNSGTSATTVDTSITLTSTGANVTWAKMSAVNTFGSLKGSDDYLAQGTTLGASGTIKQYFVVYLKNTGADQTTADAGRDITGTVTVTASTGAQIEATF